MDYAQKGPSVHRANVGMVRGAPAVTAPLFLAPNETESLFCLILPIPNAAEWELKAQRKHAQSLTTQLAAAV
jgi:hypothetical protein